MILLVDFDGALLADPLRVLLQDSVLQLVDDGNVDLAAADENVLSGRGRPIITRCEFIQYGMSVEQEPFSGRRSRAIMGSESE